MPSFGSKWIKSFDSFDYSVTDIYEYKQFVNVYIWVKYINVMHNVLLGHMWYSYGMYKVTFIISQCIMPHIAGRKVRVNRTDCPINCFLDRILSLLQYDMSGNTSSGNQHMVKQLHPVCSCLQNTITHLCVNCNSSVANRPMKLVREWVITIHILCEYDYLSMILIQCWVSR